MTPKLTNMVMNELFYTYVSADLVPSEEVFSLLALAFEGDKVKARTYFSKLYEENRGTDPLAPLTFYLPGDLD